MIDLVAEITKLDGSIYTINSRNLISLNISTFDRRDVNLPSWGLISNTGSIEFVDFDGQIKALAETNQLEPGMQVNIRLVNTISKKFENIGAFVTEQWDYDSLGKTVNISLKDGLEKLQSVDYEGVLYDFLAINRDYKYVYDILYNATIKSTNISICSFDMLDVDTQNRLLDSVLKCFYLNPANLWAQWNKFCEATQTYMYKDANGVLTCKYLGGN